MCRPVKLVSYTWDVGQDIFYRFNPWTLFFENPKVLARVANFHCLRAKLVVKIVINGNSFMYGRAVASYLPLIGYDDFTRDRAFFREDLVEATQRPKIFLNPTNSQGGNLVLPFCWRDNALSVPLKQWQEMGEMSIRSIWPLKHANGGTAPITISVFAWAEDVHLSIPTSAAPFVAQSGEYTGIVSKPMAALAKVAGMLRAVPSIAPYAMATETAAKAIGSVAYENGYSRPVQVQSTTFMEPLVVDNCANTSGLDSSQKLTFDPKQEVTIDPRTMGLGDADEMNIKSIASRESWLTSFRWNVNSVSEQLLWNTEVQPTLWAENGTEIHMPACCFVNMPFKSWRGTMKFRFQVISSAYHKGRLRVSYDPRFQDTNDYNTNYNYIVDIASQTDFTVEVGWGSTRPMVDHRNPGFDPLPYGTTTLLAPGFNANGILSIFVVNELTTPNTTVDNDIVVAVYVSMGDDFEVFNPASGLLDDYTFADPELPLAVAPVAAPQLLKKSSPTSVIEDIDLAPEEILSPQTGGYEGEEDRTPMEDMPEHQESTICLAECRKMDALGAVYYGDPIVSLRQILKRYVFHNALTGTSTNGWHNWTMPNYPVYRGADVDGIHTSVNGKYNYVHNVPITWFTPAYVCRKGSVRWKYMRDSLVAAHVMVVNRFASASAPGYTFYPLGTASTASGRSRDVFFNMYSCWTGGAFTSCDMKPSLSVTFPHQTSTRFNHAKSRALNSTARGEQLQPQFHNVMVKGAGSGVNWPVIYGLVAAGDDYTLSFYTGPPVVFRRDRRSDPTPA